MSNQSRILDYSFKDYLCQSKYLKKCILCGAKEFKKYSSGYDYELQTCSNKWKFLKCDNCGHIQLNPRPIKENLKIIYPINYYSYEISKKLNYLILRGKDFLDFLKLKSIIRFSKNHISTYLDIGCGDGRYLKLVNKICKIPKKEIFGTEINLSNLKILKQEGFSVFDEKENPEKCIRKNSISLITMFHVIEHLDNPKDFILQMSYLLEKKGIIVIETPNVDSLDNRLFQRTYWGGYHFPRHWHLFSKKTLTKLILDSGFEITNVNYLPGHSFWLYSFHHLFKYEWNLPSIAKFMDPMKSKLFLIIFTLFDIVRARLGFKTSSIMIVARKI